MKIENLKLKKMMSSLLLRGSKGVFLRDSSKSWNKRWSLFTMHSKLSTNKGFTLLFAVLVSVLVLAVGASIISIALKQVVLSGAGRESQFAFYAANTGLECALYWDLHPKAETDGSLSYVFPAKFLAQGGPDQNRWSTAEEITCGGTTALPGQIINGANYGGAQNFTNSGQDFSTDNDYTFRMAITNDVGVYDVLYCAEVKVTKSYSDPSNAGTGRITTTISSKGLNTCDPENNPRAVERGLVLQYQS